MAPSPRAPPTKPFLPVCRFPLDAIPSLLPWSAITALFLPFAPPEILDLLPPPPSLPRPPVAWSATLEAYYTTFTYTAMKWLREDAEMDEAALLWYGAELAKPLKGIGDVDERREMVKEAEALRGRVLTRWLRLYAVPTTRSSYLAANPAAFRNNAPLGPLYDDGLLLRFGGSMCVWPYNMRNPTGEYMVHHVNLFALPELSTVFFPDVKSPIAAELYTSIFGAPASRFPPLIHSSTVYPSRMPANALQITRLSSSSASLLSTSGPACAFPAACVQS